MAETLRDLYEVEEVTCMEVLVVVAAGCYKELLAAAVVATAEGENNMDKP